MATPGAGLDTDSSDQSDNGVHCYSRNHSRKETLDPEKERKRDEDKAREKRSKSLSDIDITDRLTAYTQPEKKKGKVGRKNGGKGAKNQRWKGKKNNNQ